MSRLIDIGTDPVAELRLRVGDVVSFGASGGRVEEGGSAVEALGAFQPAIVATDGTVMSPETPPTTILFRATGEGRARLSLFSGLDWAAPTRRSVDIVVGD